MDADVKKLISETVDSFMMKEIAGYPTKQELTLAIRHFKNYHKHSPYGSPYTCRAGIPQDAPESWEAEKDDVDWFCIEKYRSEVPYEKRKEMEARLKKHEEEQEMEKRRKAQGKSAIIPPFPKTAEDEFAPEKLSDLMSLVKENGQTEPNDQTTPSVLPPSGEEKYNKQEPGGVMSAVNIEEIQNKIASIDEDSFRVYNDTLCPMLWDEYKHLNPRVRVNLLRMAYDFYDKTDFQAPIKDIYLMGSAANYNWTPDSDADVHVIVDFNQLKMPIETAEKAAKVAGAAWNNEHKVWAKGHKVEINIQNASEPKPHVTGIYSLVNDQWLRMPSHQNVEVNKPLIQQKYSAMKDYIIATVQSGNYELMKQAKKYLDAFRQYGLDSAGELSVENIVFKILRSRGFIKNLKDAITATYDKEMTVSEDMPWKDDNVEFEGKSEEEKTALIQKLIPQLDDDKLVATVNKFPEMPQASYVQVDMVHDGINYFSTNAEMMNRLGYKMPSTQELLRLPTGKYKLSDIKKKLELNESKSNFEFETFTLFDCYIAGQPGKNWFTIYEFGSRIPNKGNAEKALLELKKQYGYVAVTDIGYPDDNSYKFWKHMLSKKIVDEVHDANGKVHKKSTTMSEVTQKDINAKYPPASALYKTPSGRPIAGNYDYSKLTLSNLKSMRIKVAQMIKDYRNAEDKSIVQVCMLEYRQIDAEIKKRLAYINAPIAEGYTNDPDYNSALDFHERRDRQMCEIADFLKKHRTQRIPWKTIPASLLKKTWLVFGKYNRVDENDIDKIADQLMNNIARLEVANSFQGHSRFSIRDEIIDNCGIEFTDAEWNNNVWRFCDKKGLDYVSDYGIEPLMNIYGLIFKAKTPEEKLYACDKALNVVHQRNDLASMFVEGGRATLRAVADQGGYDAGYEHGQMNRDHRNSRMEEGVGAGIPEQDRLHIPGHRWQIKSKDAPKTPKMKEGEEKFVNELVEQLLTESPKLDVLKKNRKTLTDDERNMVVSAGAVWDNNDPGVWKSVVDGKTWYVCNTHRAYQCKPTIKGAIKAFEFIETTS